MVIDSGFSQVNLTNQSSTCQKLNNITAQQKLTIGENCGEDDTMNGISNTSLDAMFWRAELFCREEM